MPETEPTQREESRSKRSWLLYASILCSLLASATLWFERDSGDLDKRADVIGGKIERLSERLTNFEKEASGDNLPEQTRARRIAVKEEATAIQSEIDTLQTEIDAELKTFTTSPVQKALTVTAVILIGLQLIFLIAYLNSPRGVARHSSRNDPTAHNETASN